jgi:hypothetical protein
MIGRLREILRLNCVLQLRLRCAASVTQKNVKLSLSG